MKEDGRSADLDPIPISSYSEYRLPTRATQIALWMRCDGIDCRWVRRLDDNESGSAHIIQRRRLAFKGNECLFPEAGSGVTRLGIFRPNTTETSAELRGEAREHWQSGQKRSTLMHAVETLERKMNATSKAKKPFPDDTEKVDGLDEGLACRLLGDGTSCWWDLQARFRAHQYTLGASSSTLRERGAIDR